MAFLLFLKDQGIYLPLSFYFLFSSCLECFLLSYDLLFPITSTPAQILPPYFFKEIFLDCTIKISTSVITFFPYILLYFYS